MLPLRADGRRDPCGADFRCVGHAHADTGAQGALGLRLDVQRLQRAAFVEAINAHRGEEHGGHRRDGEPAEFHIVAKAVVGVELRAIGAAVGGAVQCGAPGVVAVDAATDESLRPEAAVVIHGVERDLCAVGVQAAPAAEIDVRVVVAEREPEDETFADETVHAHCGSVGFEVEAVRVGSVAEAGEVPGFSDKEAPSIPGGHPGACGVVPHRHDALAVVHRHDVLSHALGNGSFLAGGRRADVREALLHAEHLRIELGKTEVENGREFLRGDQVEEMRQRVDILTVQVGQDVELAFVAEDLV